MTDPFLEKPLLNSPCGYASRLWELDETGQPTQPADAFSDVRPFFFQVEAVETAIWLSSITPAMR